MVQHVEELRADLDVETLRETPDVMILAERHIEVGDARSGCDVAPAIPQAIARGCDEALRLDVVIWIARVDGILAFRCVHAVRECERVCVSDSERVARDEYREGHS